MRQDGSLLRFSLPLHHLTRPGPIPERRLHPLRVSRLYGFLAPRSGSLALASSRRAGLGKTFPATERTRGGAEHQKPPWTYFRLASKISFAGCGTTI
jgi:hypothetical protein